jgi:hypothetical protein
MAYTNQIATYHDVGFNDRMLMAITTAAVAVLSEAADTPLHTARLAYATAFIGSPSTYLTNFVLVVCTDPLITTSSSDDDIQAAVKAKFNDMIGTVV